MTDEDEPAPSVPTSTELIKWHLVEGILAIAMRVAARAQSDGIQMDIYVTALFSAMEHLQGSLGCLFTRDGQIREHAKH